MIATAPTGGTTGCLCVCYDCGGTNTGCSSTTWTIDTTTTTASSISREELEMWAELERLAEEAERLALERERRDEANRLAMALEGRRPTRPRRSHRPAIRELYKTVRRLHAV